MSQDYGLSNGITTKTDVNGKPKKKKKYNGGLFDVKWKVRDLLILVWSVGLGRRYGTAYHSGRGAHNPESQDKNGHRSEEIRRSAKMGMTSRSDFLQFSHLVKQVVTGTPIINSPKVRIIL